MEVTSGAEEAFVREWTPCTHILNLIPPRIQNGLFSSELCLTCVDAVSEYIALGTNVGLVYWYDRKKGNIQRLRCEASTSSITYVKIVNTVDYMVGAGNAAGQVTVFQIPKEHPENIPDTFKPKVEPKVERYTIGDLHKSKITAIEWSKNGMRLFSGDKDGVIIMTEIDFYMHLCKSMEIVNERHEIVQMSYCQNTLLVSSLYRTIVCERRDSRWHVTQLGKKERKTLCALGAVVMVSYAAGARGPPVAYCARPGLRLWRAGLAGDVLHTLLLQEAISNPLTVAELLNPATKVQPRPEREELGPLYVFREHFLVSHNDRVLYVLDPRSAVAVAVVDDLRRILSVSVTKEEIFVLEGPRSLVRLAQAPEPAALVPEEPLGLMSKSLSSSLQQAVCVVERARAVVLADECVERPPSRLHEPLHSIVSEFTDTSSDASEIRRQKSEELQRKLKLYKSIMSRGCDERVVHSSRRRHAAPEPTHNVGGPPIPPTLTLYRDTPQSDDALEKQIEEKEKILAKMLDLESLSITVPKAQEPHKEEAPEVTEPTYTRVEVTPFIEPEPISPKVKSKPTKLIEDPNLIDLLPKIVQLPTSWNLGNIELKLENTNGFKENGLASPEDHIDSDWEII